MTYHSWTPEEEKLLLDLYLYKRWHVKTIAKYFKVSIHSVTKKIKYLRNNSKKNEQKF